MHYTIGNLGHFLIILSFITSLLSACSYFFSIQSNDLNEQKAHFNLGKISYYIHSLAVLGIIICLFVIIINHYYEYYYAWDHSDNDLEKYYMIASFWDGQEGSFLLWIFWNVVLGIILMNTSGQWTAHVMSVFALVQAFLTSMILGVEIPFIEFNIGSDPFILLRDALPDDLIFKENPTFIPFNGTGLNPLLQNYWMIIHPPTLFLGYASTLIPFSFVIAGLATKKYKEWIKPALPWTLFSTAILGIGILMGGYWAYETLTFGGWWAWDPVENVSLIPWLTLVGAYHSMIAYRQSNTALKTGMIMVVITFILVLYATFLIRSGILGESSVHAFVDLGLSGQLLLYLMTFVFLSIGLFITRWKEIPTTDREVSTYSREFWIFLGVTVLSLMAFQILIPTSFPVINKVASLFGGDTNLALPTEPLIFYTKWQMWFSIGLAILSGTGQFFWWKKMDAKKLQEAMTIPVLATFILAGLFVVYFRVREWQYILLSLAAIYSLVTNASILFSLTKKSNFKLSGGALAHMGIAIMILGILISSGYERILSENNTGIKLFSDVLAEEGPNRDNLPLVINTPWTPKWMPNYTLKYKGRRLDVKGFPDYVSFDQFKPTRKRTQVIALNDLSKNGKTYFKEGDTLDIHPENIYFEIEYKEKSSGKIFKLFPRIQVNPSMGTVPSPDIKRELDRDLYTHISYAPYLTKEDTIKWSDPMPFDVKLKEQTVLPNDMIGMLEEVKIVDEHPEIRKQDGDVMVAAKFKLWIKNAEGMQEVKTLEPYFVIRNNMIASPPVYLQDSGVSIRFVNVDPAKNIFSLTMRTTDKDFIVLKVIEKPMINILWIGTLIMTFGFLVATRRRYLEFLKARKKELQTS